MALLRSLPAIALLVTGCTAEATLVAPPPPRVHRYVQPAPLAAPAPVRRDPEVHLTERRPGPDETHAETREEDPFAPVVRVNATTGRDIGTCLGVMVAPRIALTAGHCVDKRARITVKGATSRTETAVVASFWSDAHAPDYRHRETIDTSTSDVSILVLDRPLRMPRYAAYARRPIDGEVAAVGLRHAPGVLESKSVLLAPTESSRFYASPPFTKRGDSGGPVFIRDWDKLVVVGVTSGSSPERSIFARVDLVAKKLDELVSAHAK